jgi:hypothetical protein
VKKSFIPFPKVLEILFSLCSPPTGIQIYIYALTTIHHMQSNWFKYVSDMQKATLTHSRQNHPLYRSPEVGSVYASVWDLTSSGLPQDVSPGTVDIVILVFVLSALHPDEWGQAINNIQKVSRSISQLRSGLRLTS